MKSDACAAAPPTLPTTLRQLDIHVATERFADVVREALALAFTRDPFDRLLVAHAALLKMPLITQDRVICRHYVQALS